MGTPSCPSLRSPSSPGTAVGRGAPASASGSLEQQGAFSARGSDIVCMSSVGRGAPFSEMNPLFQSAYEGFQAVEGEVGEASAWSPGAGGWELGAGQVVGALGSLRGLCVYSVQPLTVGGEKQVLSNPTTIPPTPREGRRSKGGGRGCGRPDPAPCGQKAGRPETV